MNRNSDDMHSEDIQGNETNECKETQPVTPPDVKREFELEQEWAETLGMDFDAERARSNQTPPPYAGGRTGSPESGNPERKVVTGGNSELPPIYTMSPDEMPQPEPVQNPNFGFRPEPMPETFMLWAILATICCCLPAGVVAIFHSSTVSSRYYARDYEGARRASHNAEKWIIASIVLGVLSNALYMPLSLMMPV